ncbi:collagen alpha-1(X) chain precursor-like protein [Daphnia sinensis]|uniref:Collagen alpha-1(X) chain-like protein n=1 Tax=Daphnia sinensis TaxID=1820382 RepID=A0AAD5KSP0_9CRUS|nr:collagen alpha-1(X) chain precursor-like protein [Daphnia sinensis]
MAVGTTTRTGMQSSTTTQPLTTTRPTSLSNASTQTSTTTRPTSSSNNASTQASTTTRPTSPSNASTQASTTTRPGSSSNTSTQASAITNSTRPSNASTQALGIANSTQSSNVSTQASGTTRPTPPSNASTQASGITNSTPLSNASTQASASTRPTPTMDTRNATTNAAAGTLGMANNSTTKQYVSETTVSTPATTANLMSAGNAPETELPSNAPAEAPAVTEATVNVEIINTTPETTLNAETQNTTPETTIDVGPLATTVNPTTNADLPETSETPAKASTQAAVTTETESIPAVTESTTNAETKIVTTETTAANAGTTEDLEITDDPTTSADPSETSEIPSNFYAQALTMTEPTSNMENKHSTSEATTDAGALTTSPTSASPSESSDSGQVSEEEIRVFTDIANNIVKKKLVAVEEEIAKMASKLNGEQGRGSKTLANVAFFAQRNSSFDKQHTIQPYLINRLNDGKAFDQASGIFTVPINGNYHFYFTALKSSAQISGTSMVTVRLWANKNQKEKAQQMLAEGHVNSNDMHGWFPVILQATVKLQEKDTVEVELLIGSIHESEDPEHLITSFGGFLVSPEVM